MIASHFILFFRQLFRHTKVMIGCPQVDNDNIVPPVSIVISKIEAQLETTSRPHLLLYV